jgi:hypothetical protein
MSASHISEIYAAIKAVTVTTASGITPTAYDLDALPENVVTAHLPCRLMLPLSPAPVGGRDAEYIAIGTGMTVIWQLNDLMLWQASEQGLGLRQFAPELVDYCGKYLDAMRAKRCVYNNDDSLEGISMTPGEYEWPRGTGRFYAGVLCQLTIKEVVHG